MIPNRMRWSSLEEQVFDFIDDSQHEINKRSNLFNPEFTQIGVACNCHDIYGEICIVELGANVVGKEHLETITHDVYRYGVELEHSHANENDTMPIPEFLPKGSPNCARGRTDTICGEVENTDYADYVSTLNMGRPSSFLNDTSVHDYYEVAHNLFMSIQALRANTVTFKTTHVVQNYTKKVMKNWATSYTPFKWSESLAMAARQVLNFQEPCGTNGDFNGHQLPEVLS